MVSYKRIKNTTLQGLEVIVRKKSGGYDNLWLPSKTTVVVPAESITDLVRVAEKRQMLKITNA